MNLRHPSPERVARYVREEMIDGASLADVMKGKGRTGRASTIVRWRVWARLRAEGYSYKGIAARFSMDHSTVRTALLNLAKGLAPFANCRNNRTPLLSAPRRSHRRTRPKLIRCVGYDPTKRHLDAS